MRDPRTCRRRVQEFPERIAKASSDVGIDDDPAIFGHGQIRGQSSAAARSRPRRALTSGTSQQMLTLRAPAVWVGEASRNRERYRKHGIEATWRRMGRARGIWDVSARRNETRAYVVGHRSYPIHASLPRGCSGVAHEIQLGECTGCRAETRSVGLPDSLAAIVRVSRNDVAVLKLEPRHQALKLWDEMWTQETVTVVPSPWFRPDGHVRVASGTSGSTSTSTEAVAEGGDIS